jgi:hypothetical protein
MEIKNDKMERPGKQGKAQGKPRGVFLGGVGVNICPHD